MTSGPLQDNTLRTPDGAKWLGRAAALVGLIAALWLVWRDDPRAVLRLMSVAGPGLVVAALVHVLAMLANAWDWRLLLAGEQQPALLRMLRMVWVRESVNCMLPVARVGGELASFRMMRRWGVSGPLAAASLVTDIQLTLISQMLFTAIGIAFLLLESGNHTLRIAADLVWGVVIAAPVLLLFSLVHHVRPFERLARAVNAMASGRLTSLVGHSADVDRTIRDIWSRRATVLQYLFIWQPLQCLATSLELLVALHFLGADITVLQAFVLESLIQAVSSAAFFVPGALGVQEGGFVVIGSALGIDPAACLALAGARRIRDLLIYIPGLIAWQRGESQARVTAPASE
jgi:putative membrane protein